MTENDLVLVAQVRADARSGRARDTREAADVAQAEIAEVCGVAPATVSLWESGKRAPRGKAALKYARILRLLETSRSTAA
jgi:transcriptional regulator with XRE-family HTH domain